MYRLPCNVYACPTFVQVNVCIFFSSWSYWIFTFFVKQTICNLGHPWHNPCGWLGSKHQLTITMYLFHFLGWSMYILLKPVWTGRNRSARIPKQMAVSATSLNFFVFSQQFRVPEGRVHIGCTTCARKFSQDTGHNQTKQWGTAKMISFLSWKRDSFGRSLSKWHL